MCETLYWHFPLDTNNNNSNNFSPFFYYEVIKQTEKFCLFGKKLFANFSVPSSTKKTKIKTDIGYNSSGWALPHQGDRCCSLVMKFVHVWFSHCFHMCALRKNYHRFTDFQWAHARFTWVCQRWLDSCTMRSFSIKSKQTSQLKHHQRLGWWKKAYTMYIERKAHPISTLTDNFIPFNHYHGL